MDVVQETVHAFFQRLRSSLGGGAGCEAGEVGQVLGGAEAAEGREDVVGEVVEEAEAGTDDIAGVIAVLGEAGEAPAGQGPYARRRSRLPAETAEIRSLPRLRLRRGRCRHTGPVIPLLPPAGI